MIDVNLLPPRAMVDTNVFMRGVLRDRPYDPESPVCIEFCNAMLDNGKKLFVAAPTLAEITRHKGSRVPRYQNVVVVPFDERAAEILGANMPMATLREVKDSSGLPMTYLKYDSMILSCAIRSGVQAFVTMDVDYHTLAKGTNVKVMSPEAYKSAQLSLVSILLQVPGRPTTEPVSK